MYTEFGMLYGLCEMRQLNMKDTTSKHDIYVLQ